ncbi:MAG TPA: glycosyl hydrolase [Chloroflexota bacterium]
MTADVQKNLEYRLVGPFRGGRVGAVAGDPADARVFYFGSTGGGVWKTFDGGLYWQNVSDGFFKRASVGAIAVASADPNVVYVGMGESCIRGNVSHGDGVYRSTDAGKTWSHLGLDDTRHIAKIRVHPADPNLVYVAALGHAHGPNEQRGVFRSRDGGQTWEHVLSRGADAGASDLSLDPHNPRVVYAAIWEARRGPHSLSSGGSASGLFKSIDGGDTWSEISRNKNMPRGVLGKIGVCVSGGQRDRVYAIVEAEDGAVFRSDDGGQTWDRLNDNREMRQRAWYYHHIVADPKDPETVWVLSVDAWRSTDGGQTFAEFAIPHGDNHDLWIDPTDTRRMIEGNDGGACVTFNAGASWSSLYNQPTAELYHVTTDTRTPYRLFGAQQDNTTISVPSRSPLTAITNAESWEVGGGESGYVAVRPDNPDIIFAGSYLGYLTRYDHRTGQARAIDVWPEETLGAGARDARYRFQWTFPTLLSPHDPDVLYATGNCAFRSTDEGTTWHAISPDLTRNDPATLESSGGPLTQDNTGAEYYGTIFAFAESPRQRGVLWAGSDDGLVHVSRDDGATWHNVTPPDLPEWSLISIIEPSPHDAACAYVAATRYKLDDFAPYLFKTIDYGASWTRITSGLADNVFCRVIREDPTRRGLLYCGTETGVHVSFDDGAAWQPLQGTLPVVPVHDLAIKEPEGDLLLATHGRSFWILDDLGPVRALHDHSPQVFVRPRPVVKYMVNGGFSHKPTRGKNYRMPGPLMITYTQVEDPRTGDKTDNFLDAARNPPDGAIIHYVLSEVPDDHISLTFLEADGREIRTFSSRNPEDEATTEEEKQAARKNRQPRIPKQQGLNRWVWNLRYPDATKIDDDDAANELVEGAIAGPSVPPGTYLARLTVGDRVYEHDFEVRKDPRVSASEADLRAQFELLSRLHQRLSETHVAINQLRVLRRRAEDWSARSRDKPDLAAVHQAAQALLERLKPIESELIQVKAKSRGDTLNFPVRLNGKLAALSGLIASADSAPTASARAVFDELSKRVQVQLDQLSEVMATEVAFLNQSIDNARLPAVDAS